MTQVSIVGTGYVGLCTGVLLAELGHEVTLVDLDPSKVQAVKDGRAPFHEPGLDEALKQQVTSGRLDATTDTQRAVDASALTYLCVGTPQDETGAADLTAIEQAARDVGKALAGLDAEHVVVTKSTVPPGTTRDVVRPAALQAAGDHARGRVSFAMNPEFLREGSALSDARDPDKIVIGAEDPATGRAVEALFEDLEAPIVHVDPSTAETIKYANNAFLATKVGFANEMANVCEAVGADWVDVAEAIGLDDRISERFLRAGLGFGGSCFPKDVAAIAHVAREHGVPSGILDAVLEGNEVQPLRAVELLEAEIGDLAGKRVALLGLSFKPGTDDVRRTRAAPIHDALVDRGAEVVCHDPQASSTFHELRPDATLAETVEDALTGADGCIAQTAWPAYAELGPDRFQAWMVTPVVVDGRRVFDADAMGGSSVTYRAIGLGGQAPDS